MIKEASECFINNPIFLKYKTKLNIFKGRSKYLKSFNINERIVEIPFAIQCLNSLPKGGHILDLGCTESIFPLNMASLGFQVTGVDFRKYHFKHPNFKFYQADILNLPFEDKTFDAVSAISTLEHIGLGSYDDPQVKDKPDAMAVRHISRVLKTNGIFILTVPFGRMLPNTHQRVYDQKMVDDLLINFNILEIRYLTLISEYKNDMGMYWNEVSLKEAAVIESGSSTKTVCLIKASLK